MKNKTVKKHILICILVTICRCWVHTHAVCNDNFGEAKKTKTTNVEQLFKNIVRLRRETVNIHSGEFCVDVSTYSDVKFEPITRNKCETNFIKQCENKSQEVCGDVTEIKCEIVGYPVCEMSMEAVSYKSHEMVPMEFLQKTCKQGSDVVQHTKMMPECRNITKQNCITNWEEGEGGKQIWTGNEQCEPVTWRDCKLVPRQVDFKIPTVKCEEGDPVPYMDCMETTEERMIGKLTCRIQHTTDCKAVTSNKCTQVNFNECTEIPKEECTKTTIMMPIQEKEHKKKCLLTDTSSSTKDPPPTRSPKAKKYPAKLPIQTKNEGQRQLATNSALVNGENTQPLTASASVVQTYKGTVGPAHAVGSSFRVSQNSRSNQWLPRKINRNPSSTINFFQNRPSLRTK